MQDSSYLSLGIDKAFVREVAALVSVHAYTRRHPNLESLLGEYNAQKHPLSL